MTKEKTYNGKQIEKAGKELMKLNSNSKEFDEAMNILSFWRSTHEKPLDIAFILLQKIVSNIDKNAIYGKRLKRYFSIMLKLKRFEKMNLKNMQDIGGCRVVVGSIKKLNKVVKKLRKQSTFVNSEGKIRFKDYISNPKDDGYRCYHLIGNFGDTKFNRNIEIQVRTSLQHDWATALEIVDLFTKQSLKSNNGDKKWSEFFTNISKLFAYIETIHLFKINDLRSINEFKYGIENNKELKESFEYVKNLSKILDIIRRFEAFTLSTDFVTDKFKDKNSGYILIEINLDKRALKAKSFSEKDLKKAESEYIEAEKKSVGENNLVIALVSTTHFGELRNAYPNYFADSTEFIKYLFFINNI